MPGLHGSVRPIPGSPWKGPEAFSVPSAWRSPPSGCRIWSRGWGWAAYWWQRLGTINQVGLTADYLHRRGIPLQGIVLNRFQPGNPMHEDNRALCELVSGARVVACVPEGAAALDCTVEELKALYG